MSAATGTAPEGASGPQVYPQQHDELELSCIVCHGHVGKTEKVLYWPPAPDRPGCIAHYRCLNESGSL